MTRTPSEAEKFLAVSQSGDLAKVKKMLARNPGLAKVNTEVVPPLVASTLAGHRKMAELLLSGGADVNLKNKEVRCTPHALSPSRSEIGMPWVEATHCVLRNLSEPGLPLPLPHCPPLVRVAPPC